MLVAPPPVAAAAAASSVSAASAGGAAPGVTSMDSIGPGSSGAAAAAVAMAAGAGTAVAGAGAGAVAEEEDEWRVIDQGELVHTYRAPMEVGLGPHPSFGELALLYGARARGRQGRSALAPCAGAASSGAPGLAAGAQPASLPLRVCSTV